MNAKMFDGVVRWLTSVMCISKLRRVLILLCVLDTLSYEYVGRVGIISVKKGDKKVGKLYKLIGKIVSNGVVALESHEASLLQLPKVVKGPRRTLWLIANGMKFEVQRWQIRGLGLMNLWTQFIYTKTD